MKKFVAYLVLSHVMRFPKDTSFYGIVTDVFGNEDAFPLRMEFDSEAEARAAGERAALDLLDKATPEFPRFNYEGDELAVTVDVFVAARFSRSFVKKEGDK